MQTNPAVEQSKIIRWSESPWNQSSIKGRGLRKTTHNHIEMRKSDVQLIFGLLTVGNIQSSVVITAVCYC